jgi:hypothetical protein
MVSPLNRDFLTSAFPELSIKHPIEFDRNVVNVESVICISIVVGDSRIKVVPVVQYVVFEQPIRRELDKKSRIKLFMKLKLCSEKLNIRKGHEIHDLFRKFYEISTK